MKKLLPIPTNFVVQNAYEAGFCVPNVSLLQKQAEDWRKMHDLKPVGGDRTKIHMLVIDDQFDFSFPTGSLYVGGRTGTGAMDDQKRLAEFVYRNLGVISQITPTMDTHFPFQIFYPVAHMLQDGSHPEPNTIILADEYRSGKFQANPAMARQIGVDPVWLSRQFAYYCDQLEAKGKYKLYLWPYHCMIGSGGHRLAGVIEEARLFHSFARGAANLPEIKGGNALTEHYSIFRPEVTTCWDSQSIPGAQKNTQLLKRLVTADYIIIAGQAASHCVKESIEDLLAEILALDPALAKKVYILRDCTSSVVVPGIVDFTPDAEAAMQKFQDAGMNLVESTTPMENWPGMRL
jgi:nicotinamidase-related amidase